MQFFDYFNARLIKFLFSLRIICQKACGNEKCFDDKCVHAMYIQKLINKGTRTITYLTGMSLVSPLSLLLTKLLFKKKALWRKTIKRKNYSSCTRKIDWIRKKILNIQRKIQQFKILKNVTYSQQTDIVAI